jgi:Ca-activated chloride channel family protein
VKFAQPLWFVLLVLLPLLAAAAVLMARFRKSQWAVFVAPRLRGVLVKRGSPLPRWFALLFLLAACAAIVTALARPQGDDGIRTEKSLGRNLLVALDLSRSMRVKDVKPDRLAQAKTVIYELLESMPHERVGLIGFAGASYVYAPLTVDHQAVRETVEQIDETWAPLGGSDLASAIHLATETLKKTGQKNNALVILSDGEKHEGDLDAMIAEAQRSGVYILAIGLGTEDGDYVPNPDFPGNRMVDRSGQPVISRLQPEVMRKLATETKGRYAVAGIGMDIPAMVKSFIKDLDAFEMEGRERTIPIEFYQWLLLPAIVFLLGSVLAGTRWRGVNAAALAAGVFLTPTPARADEVSAAKDALVGKQYPQAFAAYRKLAEGSRIRDRKARFRFGEGTAAYRGGEFKEARSAFSQALLSADSDLLANAHLGLGNSLFQLGWRGLADETYPAGPAQVPDLERFDRLVKERLAKLRETTDPKQEGQAGGYAQIETLITNWADAVRHFNSSLAASPSAAAAGNNGGLTMTYLKRLRQLLEQDQQETEESMPQPQPGEGQPQPGEGDPKEKPEGEEGDKGPKPPGNKGQGENEEPKDGSGDAKEKPEDKGGQKKDDKESDKGDRDPNESPADRARRKLKENADLEKGPLTPGRREFRDPEKDW